jgi:hypothetical protein
LLVLLSNAEGHDRFTFYVPSKEGVVQLDFPNHSTNYVAVQATLGEMMNEWGTLEVR